MFEIQWMMKCTNGRVKVQIWVRRILTCRYGLGSGPGTGPGIGPGTGLGIGPGTGLGLGRARMHMG